MRIIYLDGPPATGKTTRARQLKEQYPGQVVVMGQLDSMDEIALAADWQGVSMALSANDLIVVIDPDGQPMPPFTFEIEKFEPGAWQQS